MIRTKAMQERRERYWQARLKQVEAERVDKLTRWRYRKLGAGR